MQSDDLAIARQIACPVVLISSLQKDDSSTSEQTIDLYMVSSVNYVNLEPLVISTTFLKSSKTGLAALASKRMAVSILSFQQLEAVEKLGSLSASEKAGNTAEENLSRCGFATGRLQSGQLFIKESVAFGLRIIDQTELEQYIVVLAELDEVKVASSEKFAPLIRYNRLYGTIDKGRLSQGHDCYPV